MSGNTPSPGVQGCHDQHGRPHAEPGRPEFPRSPWEGRGAGRTAGLSADAGVRWRRRSGGGGCRAAGRSRGSGGRHAGGGCAGATGDGQRPGGTGGRERKVERKRRGERHGWRFLLLGDVLILSSRARRIIGHLRHLRPALTTTRRTPPEIPGRLRPRNQPGSGSQPGRRPGPSRPSLVALTTASGVDAASSAFRAAASRRSAVRRLRCRSAAA